MNKRMDVIVIIIILIVRIIMTILMVIIKIIKMINLRNIQTWNLNATILSVITGALGIIRKALVKILRK